MVLILIGVSGSGKTTIGRLLSKELDWPFFDGDDFHPEANLSKMRAGIPLGDDDREAWLSSLQRLIHQQCENGQNVIVACSALKQKYRERLRQNHENNVTFVYLKGDFELIRQRLQSRPGHFMNPSLLASQFDALEEPDGVLTIQVTQEQDAIVERIGRELQLISPK
jgi:gluconokinase